MAIKGTSVWTWGSFEEELARLRIQVAALGNSNAEFLFRGQSNSAWALDTTLERRGCAGMRFDEYYRLAVHQVKPTVESLTNTHWPVEDYDLEMETSFRDDHELFEARKFPSPKFYEYLVYLRHHGFPSPLLDWTSSAHVAAFFAFRERTAAEACSIFVYCERPSLYGIKGYTIGEPTMRPIGKYVRTHARHFRQQSNYTICAKFNHDEGGWRFHNHEGVFGGRSRQDFVWKFDFPTSLRDTMLKSLDAYNLNAFSLFDTQEALLETMWLREHGPDQ
jgi:hypothetical protein